MGGWAAPPPPIFLFRQDTQNRKRNRLRFAIPYHRPHCRQGRLPRPKSADGFARPKTQGCLKGRSGKRAPRRIRQFALRPVQVLGNADVQEIARAGKGARANPGQMEGQ